MKKKELENLKYENSVLNNINNSIKQTNSTAVDFYSNEEIKQLQEKLRFLKEEYKGAKESYKKSEDILKYQNQQLASLEDKCRALNAKITKHKTIKKKDVPKEVEVEEVSEEEIIHLTQVCANLEQQTKAEEKQYKAEIARQKARIGELQEEIAILTSQIKEKEQDIKFKELKMKEMSKFNATIGKKHVRVKSAVKDGKGKLEPIKQGRLRTASKSEKQKANGVKDDT